MSKVREDVGMKRSRIAPTLSGEELAELFALAEFCVSCGGSLSFGKPSELATRFVGLGLIERVREAGLSRDARRVRLTKLGWLTLLTRAEHEMRHILPAEEIDEEMAA